MADAILFDPIDDLFEFLKQSYKVLSPPLSLTHDIAKETKTGRDEITFSDHIVNKVTQLVLETE